MEYLGRTPWFYRMVDLVADAMNHAPVLLTRESFQRHEDFHAATGASWETVDRSAVRMAVMTFLSESVR